MGSPGSKSIPAPVALVQYRAWAGRCPPIHELLLLHNSVPQFFSTCPPWHPSPCSALHRAFPTGICPLHPLVLSLRAGHGLLSLLAWVTASNLPLRPSVNRLLHLSCTLRKLCMLLHCTAFLVACFPRIFLTCLLHGNFRQCWSVSECL